MARTRSEITPEELLAIGNLSWTNTWDQVWDWVTITWAWTIADPFVAVWTDTDEKVKYDAWDPTAWYVADKVIAWTWISVAEWTWWNENKLVINSTITQATRDSLWLDTDDSPQFAWINLWHASDTTLTRVGAWTIAVEWNNILTSVTWLPLAWWTMTWNITLWENATIDNDPSLSADWKYTWIAITWTAWATLAFWDLIYLDPTDSRWELADANIVAWADWDPRWLLWICVLAAANDWDVTKILLNWVVRADTAFPTLTICAPVYVSETAWDVVVAQPTTADVVIRVVWFWLTADSMYFNPSNDYITHT